MRALVINCSAVAGKRHYNLGARKLADWLRSEGHDVTYCDGDPALFAYGYDVVALSVIFSWHAPIARDIAIRVRGVSEVWCGGPGMTNLRTWWQRETGLDCTVGLDPRFERQRGWYNMTFASRGCPVGCWFCVVPRIEGREFTLYWDFQPAPVLCDNNLSALPVDFQEHILRTYRESGVRLADANSGFEPKAFDEGTYSRWRSALRVWRFAFDEVREREDVERMMRILRGEPARSKQVYVLVGNEPIEWCYERARQVIGWGGEPYCQFVKPLNYLGGPVPTKFDWTEQAGRDFCRFFNRHLWRTVPIHEYSDRRGEAPPFAFLSPRNAVAVQEGA